MKEWAELDRLAEKEGGYVVPNAPKIQFSLRAAMAIVKKQGHPLTDAQVAQLSKAQCF